MIAVTSLEAEHSIECITDADHTIDLKLDKTVRARGHNRNETVPTLCVCDPMSHRL